MGRARSGPVGNVVYETRRVVQENKSTIGEVKQGSGCRNSVVQKEDILNVGFGAQRVRSWACGKRESCLTIIEIAIVHLCCMSNRRQSEHR